MNKALRRWLLFIGLIALVLLVDQYAKYLTLTELELGESWIPIPAISDVFRVTRSINTGAAFGMFQGGSSFFLVLALITVAAFVVSYPRLPEEADLTRISIGLITGGALSNAIDRIRFDHVVDYFHVIFNNQFSNISNFADHAITLGVVILLYDQWQAEKRENAQKELEAQQATEAERLAAGFDAPDTLIVPPVPMDSASPKPQTSTDDAPTDLHGNQAHITIAANNEQQTEESA